MNDILKNTKPGDRIALMGIVMDSPGRGNVRVLLPGVGSGGTWAMPNTAEVEILGNVLDGACEG